MQARDLGSTRQALKKGLYGSGRKAAVPVTEKQRLARLRFRTQLEICTQCPPCRGAERDLAFFVAFSFSDVHLPGTISNPHVSDFQARELAHP